MNKIGIVTTAVNIEQSTIDRFKNFLLKSTNMDYKLDIITDISYVKDGLLNRSRALNDALRRMIKCCSIVVCTDIDMVIPPGLLTYIASNLKAGQNLWVVCRNIDITKLPSQDWNLWSSLPLRWSGFGSWNAMLGQDWLKSGGWDERLTGWGGEDDVFKSRRKDQGILDICCTSYPLMHVNHPPRQNKNMFKTGNKAALKLGLSGGFKKYL